jgi:hypothetical protein
MTFLGGRSSGMAVLFYKFVMFFPKKPKADPTIGLSLLYLPQIVVNFAEDMNTTFSLFSWGRLS